MNLVGSPGVFQGGLEPPAKLPVWIASTQGRQAA